MAVREFERFPSDKPSIESQHVQERVRLAFMFQPQNPERYRLDRRTLEVRTDLLRERAKKATDQETRVREEEQVAAMEALTAMLDDERIRHIAIGHIEKTSMPPVSQKDYDDVLAEYEQLLNKKDRIPEILPHVEAEDLNQRVSDLLANGKWYLEKSSDLKDLQKAKDLLYHSSFLQAQRGRKAEQALIGILRYGPSWFDGEPTNEPAMFVEHTMPREDVLGAVAARSGRLVGRFGGADMILEVPGTKSIQSLQLKTGDASSVGVLSLVAPQIIEAWEAIYQYPSLRDPRIGAERRRHLIDTYREAVQGIGEELNKHLPADMSAALNALLHVRERVRVIGPRGPREKKETSPLKTEAMTFRELKNRWENIIRLNPNLLGIGLDLTPANFHQARNAVISMMSADPANPLWKDWVIKSHIKKSLSKQQAS